MGCEWVGGDGATRRRMTFARQEHQHFGRRIGARGQLLARRLSALLQDAQHLLAPQMRRRMNVLAALPMKDPLFGAQCPAISC